ncbi:50S ribosomal protein L6 [Algiphilus aromaticivorans]|jgi:large subunit ribosomal protein L6|uniref:50S ribosomal protein L6 n=1 Tax=Algiphilus aromaticivorans TaxID=382454 RepID=UPI0005C2359C|nr:50S ribosomal protein L6 [Algiphilus aromaticivorans]
MYRVAKAPITVPKGVEVSINGRDVQVKGSKATLTMTLNAGVDIELEGDQLRVAEASAEKDPAMAGTVRANLNNMVTGVTAGFERKLQLVGVGYRAQAQGKQITLSLGYSNPVEYALPEGVSAQTPTQTEIVVSGSDRQAVGQVAAEIRALRPPEPYKGKGVRYEGERIVMKEAKKK